MDKIEQYMKEIKELLTRTTTIKATAQDEARELKDDELTILNDILDRVDTLEGLIKTEERIQAANTRMTATADTGSVIKPNAVAASNITVGIDNRSLDTFKSFGEQIVAVANQSLRGIMDPRLDKRASGMSELVPSDGGFLVQKDFAAELMKPVYENGQIFSKCKRIPIGPGKNGLKMNAIAESSRATGSRWGGIRGYWLGEAGTKTESAPKFRQVEMTLKKLIGLCYLTDELLQDAVALEGVVKQGFEDEFTFLIEDSIFRGAGAAQLLGIIGHASTVSVAIESGQGADTLLFENITKMWSRMYAKSRPGAVWFINQDIEPQLYSMSLAVGTGGVPVYMPAGGISGAPYGALMGRPVVPTELCSTIGDVGDIILADMSQYLIIDKGGAQSDRSISFKFDTDETTLRFVIRIDGQPLWSLPLTPYKGTANTLSPFVTLAERA